MNNGMQDIINSLGAMTEMWAIIYRTFVEQGFDKTEALEHTKEMFKTMLEATGLN